MSRDRSISLSLSNVFLGLALTMLMGALLFLLVGLNPKDFSYDTLPWNYALICFGGAVVFGLLAMMPVKTEPEDEESTA